MKEITSLKVLNILVMMGDNDEISHHTFNGNCPVVKGLKNNVFNRLFIKSTIK